MKPAPRYLSYTSLKARSGWSDKVIRHFLPQPDAERRNPHYRNAAPTKLYLISKVEAIEAQTDFQQQAMQTNNRKQSAQKAVEVKRVNLLQYVEHLTINVPLLPESELTELACAHYNAHHSWKAYERGGDFRPAETDSEPGFLARISLNYLRHQLTRYENELKRIAGKVGCQDAYDRLKFRINQAICQQYAHIADHYPEYEEHHHNHSESPL